MAVKRIIPGITKPVEQTKTTEPERPEVIGVDMANGPDRTAVSIPRQVQGISGREFINNIVGSRSLREQTDAIRNRARAIGVNLGSELRVTTINTRDDTVVYGDWSMSREVFLEIINNDSYADALIRDCHARTRPAMQAQQAANSLHLSDMRFPLTAHQRAREHSQQNNTCEGCVHNEGYVAHAGAPDTVRCGAYGDNRINRRCQHYDVGGDTGVGTLPAILQEIAETQRQGRRRR